MNMMNVKYRKTLLLASTALFSYHLNWKYSFSSSSISKSKEKKDKERKSTSLQLYNETPNIDINTNIANPSIFIPSPAHVLLHKNGIHTSKDDDDDIISNTKYASELTICYNNRTRQPLWVYERHVANKPDHDNPSAVISRHNMHFHMESDSAVSTQFKVKILYYVNI